jgi:hypothetical protein
MGGEEETVLMGTSANGREREKTGIDATEPWNSVGERKVVFASQSLQDAGNYTEVTGIDVSFLLTRRGKVTNEGESEEF